MPHDFEGFTGLSEEEVRSSRERYGMNQDSQPKESGFWRAFKNTVMEPMFLILLAASIIYFVTGQNGEGIFMVSAIVLVALISFYQDSRSRNALEALRQLTRPQATVIRDGVRLEIPVFELVVNDIMISEEGTTIPADGEILKSNDFSVNESILTGESLSVDKNTGGPDNKVYKGTLVVRGLAICRITGVGSATRLGKIGKSIMEIEEEKTPLQIQIENFVRKMAVAGLVVFLLVWGINFFRRGDLLESLLKALTLAMSVLPEEIPVAFTTFMALGTWRLMREGIIVKQTRTVETLGGATVICVDKTGTITENRMSLAATYELSSGKIVESSIDPDGHSRELITYGMWASEPIPFDPMEISLHEWYGNFGGTDLRKQFNMVHEYPLGGRPPMMTHVFSNGEQYIVAAKGAPLALLNHSNLDAEKKEQARKAMLQMAKKGYRVLGVGKAEYQHGPFPPNQQDFPWKFLGFLAFFDPPKKNIASVLQDFYEAGIRVKMITGDNEATSATIAQEIHFRGADKFIGGEAFVKLNADEKIQAARENNIFCNMFPEAKLEAIRSLKSGDEVVAMIGDGVNDGPALKAAHIGIAMGHKGSEVAKAAASLILQHDDLSSLVKAVAMGRRIYGNLKKAIQYIISIHIPIILTVFLPLLLNWVYPNIFSPVHVIFLELIMGPTCSIIYENEPMEPGSMKIPPRPFTQTFFQFRELSTSIIQGIMITIGCLLIYQYSVHKGYDENHTRTLVFLTLVSSNIFLTFVNRSFVHSVLSTLRYKNSLLPLIILFTILLIAIIFLIPSVTRFFKFEFPGIKEIGLCSVTGFVFVIWYEFIKGWKRIKFRQKG